MHTAPAPKWRHYKPSIKHAGFNFSRNGLALHSSVKSSYLKTAAVLFISQTMHTTASSPNQFSRQASSPVLCHRPILTLRQFLPALPPSVPPLFLPLSPTLPSHPLCSRSRKNQDWPVSQGRAGSARGAILPEPFPRAVFPALRCAAPGVLY